MHMVVGNISSAGQASCLSRGEVWSVSSAEAVEGPHGHVDRHRHHGEIVDRGETCGESVECLGDVDIHMWFIVPDTLYG